MLLVKNGKDPDDLYNASLGFWLPPNTPYGNLQLKYMKIICRIDEANRKIADSWKFWKICSDGGRLPNNALDRHVLANENVVYMLRRAGDELVSMIWLLAKYENDRDYPSEIEIDCLGAVVSQKEGQRIALFSKHIELMQKLNDIANAFKHSFINSNHTLIGSTEPRVHALGLAYNRLNADTVFYDISMNELVEKYNDFFQACVQWLLEYSEKNR